MEKNLNENTSSLNQNNLQENLIDPNSHNDFNSLSLENMKNEQKLFQSNETIDDLNFKQENESSTPINYLKPDPKNIFQIPISQPELSGGIFYNLSKTDKLKFNPISDFLKEENNYFLNEKEQKKIPKQTQRRIQNSKKKLMKSKLFILDNIIENLKFTIYHVIIIMVCILKIMVEGYLELVVTKMKTLSSDFFNWDKSNNHQFEFAQQFFFAVGTMISTYTRSVHWDVTSNAVVGIIGTLSLFFLNFYLDSVSFVSLMCVYSVCHGFILNICVNYLIDITNIKYRHFFYLFTFSFRFIGMVLFELTVYLFSIDANVVIQYPAFLTFAMPVCDLIMTFFLFFSIESLRVLFYTDKIDTLFIDLDEMGFLNEFTGIKYFMNDLQKKNYVLNLESRCDIEIKADENSFIQVAYDNSEIFNEQNIYFNPIFADDFKFKKAIYKKFEEILIEIEKRYGKQEDLGVLTAMYSLFSRIYLSTTIRSISFVLVVSYINVNFHSVYAELRIGKRKINISEMDEDKHLIDRNYTNLNNFDSIFYYLMLFLVFNLINLIQFLLLNIYLRYNTVFGYDSVKIIERSKDCCYGFDSNEFDSLLKFHYNGEETLIRRDINNSLENNLDLFGIKNSIKKNALEDLKIGTRIIKLIHFSCLIFQILVLMVFLIVQEENLFLLFIFDLLSYYYMSLIYVHFVQNSTTLLRNGTSSIMTIMQILMTISSDFFTMNISYMSIIFICALFNFVLLLVDWFLIDHSVSLRGLQKIEFNIIKNGKRN